MNRVEELVIQFPLKSVTPDLAEFDTIVALENRLEQLSDGKFDVDGHDAGSGEMNIFIVSDNAAATLESIKGAIPNELSWRAGFREVDSETYLPLAPPDLTAFEVR